MLWGSVHMRNSFVCVRSYDIAQGGLELHLHLSQPVKLDANTEYTTKDSSCSLQPALLTCPCALTRPGSIGMPQAMTRPIA